MKRKVIKQGNGTLTITLPKAWTEKVGLTGESEVEIQERKNGLIVGFSDHKKRTKEFRINLTKEELADERYIEAHLNSLYISGHDKIIINLPDKKGINKIQPIVKSNFLGYDISSSDSNKCIIDNISNPSGEKFDTILRRIFLMTKRLFEDFFSDVESRKFNNLEFHKDQANTMKAYSNYCLRIISNRTPSYSSDFALWSIVLRATHIYQMLIYCYVRLPHYKFDISKETQKFFNDIINLFDLVYALFYEYDISKTKEIHDRYYNAVYPAFYKKLLSKKGGEAFLVFHLGKAIRQILYITQFTIAYNTSQSD